MFSQLHNLKKIKLSRKIGKYLYTAIFTFIYYYYFVGVSVVRDNSDY